MGTVVVDDVKNVACKPWIILTHVTIRYMTCDVSGSLALAKTREDLIKSIDSISLDDKLVKLLQTISVFTDENTGQKFLKVPQTEGFKQGVKIYLTVCGSVNKLKTGIDFTDWLPLSKLQTLPGGKDVVAGYSIVQEAKVEGKPTMKDIRLGAIHLGRLRSLQGVKGVGKTILFTPFGGHGYVLPSKGKTIHDRDLTRAERQFKQSIATAHIEREKRHNKQKRSGKSKKSIVTSKNKVRVSFKPFTGVGRVAHTGKRITTKDKQPFVPFLGTGYVMRTGKQVIVKKGKNGVKVEIPKLIELPKKVQHQLGPMARRR